ALARALALGAAATGLALAGGGAAAHAQARALASGSGPEGIESHTLSAFLDAQQVHGGGNHAAVLTRVRHRHALANAAQPEPARAGRDALQLPVQAPHQRHFQLFVRHDRQPVISSRLLPRFAAISSGERIFASAFMVARTTLIGLRDP